MVGWMSVLKGDPIPWLLEEENPSARYLTPRDVLGKAGSDLQEARKAAMKSKLSEKILARRLLAEEGLMEQAEVQVDKLDAHDSRPDRRESQR